MASQTGSIDLKGLNVAGSVQQYFWADSDGIHVTQIPQDEYLADPANAGINILINSTNGMQVLDGLTVLAYYRCCRVEQRFMCFFVYSSYLSHIP